jgi:hypothetical protein
MISKKLVFSIFFICLFTGVFAQYQVTIEAFVFDKETKQPLQFANVEFEGKQIKAISEKDGKFTLVYDEASIGAEDFFLCSVLGYETLKVKANQLFRLLTNSNKIYLKPKPFISGKTLGMSGNIYGKVISESGPIQGATIAIKNTFNEVQTNVDGEFRIDAKEDDVLVVNFIGMLEQQVVVTDNSEINIQMQSDGELLDEVLLEGEKKVEKIVETGLGKKKDESIGYAVNTLTADDIGVGALNLADVIVGKFAGVQVAGLNVAAGSPKFIIRGGGGSITNPIPAIFVVDGVIYTEMPDFINLQQIATISILKSIIATNRYGTIGSGGAFLIKMKTFDEIQAKKRENSALVKGNKYEEDLMLIGASQSTPSYIVQLEKANSYDAALKTYNAQKRNNRTLSIPYFLDVSDYFMKWDQTYAHKILMGISQIAYNNPKALKILAYKLEERGKLKEAKKIYQRILALRPEHAQSYRDLALIYQDNGNYVEAMELYGKMLNNTDEGVDFSGLEKPINNELKHLLALHRSKIDYSRIDAEFLKADFKYDLRIVFDYNDSN